MIIEPIITSVFSNLPEAFHVPVSLFGNAKSSKPMGEMPLSEALRKIQDGAWKHDIERARQTLTLGGKDAYRNLKINLSAVTFSGTFTPTRSKTTLHAWSGFFLFDVDNLADVHAAKQQLCHDAHTAFCFISPSGEGLKAGFRIENLTTDADFKNAFTAVRQYVADQHALAIDESRKNIDGLCFVSYDHELHVNENAAVFDVQRYTHSHQQKGDNVAISTKHITKQNNGDKVAISSVWQERQKQFATATIQRILTEARDGDRHSARCKAGFLAGGYAAGGWFSDDELLTILLKASDAVADGNATKHSERTTLHNAFEAGKSKPITVEMKWEELQRWAERHGFTQRKRAIKRAEHPENAEAQWIDTNTGEILPFTDNDVKNAIDNEEAGNAELAAKLHPDKMFDNTSKEWLWYKNGIWIPDYTNATPLEIRRTLQDIFLTRARAQFQQATQMLNSANIIPDTTEGDNVFASGQKILSGELTEETMNLHNEAKKIQAQAKIAAKAAQKLNFKRRVANVESWLQSENGTATEHFDANLHHFNCTNGVLDLQTGRLLNHSTALRMKKQSIAAYDDTAECPFFLDFLETIFNHNTDIIQYVQRRLGLCLSGERSEQDLLFWYGRGANGKSVLLATLRAIYYNYFTSLPITTLLSKKYSGSDEYHLVRLQGARIVATSEVPFGATLNESMLKDMTGGEEIIARNPKGRPFAFQPSHQSIMVGNEKPRIRAQDEGTWRRLRLIPFTVTIPEAERRPMPFFLHGFIEEASGILNWLYQGYREAKDFEHNKQALPIPEIVRFESNQYRQENDVLIEFLTECVTHTKKLGDKVPLKTVFKAYSEFCERSNEHPIIKSSKQLGNELHRRGYLKDNGAENVTFIYGITVISV